MFDFSNFSYVLAAVLFILGIKKLSHPKTARDGNFLAAFGMLIAIVATLIFYSEINYQLIIVGMIIGALIGATFAIKVEMTQMPQMVAIFNGFGGGASALIASAEFLSSGDISTFTMSSIIISIFVGTLTLTGSFIAFGKLQGFISGQPIVFPGQQLLNATSCCWIVNCWFFCGANQWATKLFLFCYCTFSSFRNYTDNSNWRC